MYEFWGLVWEREQKKRGWTSWLLGPGPGAVLTVINEE